MALWSGKTSPNTGQPETAGRQLFTFFCCVSLSSWSRMKKHLTLLITLNSDFLVKVRVSFSQNYELRTRKFEQSTIKRKEDRILAINQGEANQPSEAVKSNLELTAERTDYYLIEPWYIPRFCLVLVFKPNLQPTS